MNRPAERSGELAELKRHLGTEQRRDTAGEQNQGVCGHIEDARLAIDASKRAKDRDDKKERDMQHRPHHVGDRRGLLALERRADMQGR